jgi:hypothetical protein
MRKHFSKATLEFFSVPILERNVSARKWILELCPDIRRPALFMRKAEKSFFVCAEFNICLVLSPAITTEENYFRM